MYRIELHGDSLEFPTLWDEYLTGECYARIKQ